MKNREEEIQGLELLLLEMNGIDTSAAINKIEKQGRDNILNKVQLPIYASKIKEERFWEKEKSKELVKKKYQEIGIEIINEENDLFYNVKLPENLKLRSTESKYWTELVADYGEKLADIFYKAVFYDRDAFIFIDW